MANNSKVSSDSIDIIGALSPELILHMQWLSQTDLDGKKVADVWSWVSDYLEFLRDNFNINQLYGVDPIYRSPDIFHKKVTESIKHIQDKIHLALAFLNSGAIVEDKFWESKESLDRRLQIMKQASFPCTDKENILFKDSIEKLPRRKLDYIFMTNLYYDLQNPQEFLERLSESLKKNGKLIIIDYKIGGKTGKNMFQIMSLTRSCPWKIKGITPLEWLKLIHQGSIGWWDYISFEISKEAIGNIFSSKNTQKISKYYSDLQGNKD